MKVIEINEGAKIPYEVNKTKICFDDDITINLAKRQEDWPVHIDILTDGDGVLVTGAKAAVTMLRRLIFRQGNIRSRRQQRRQQPSRRAESRQEQPTLRSRSRYRWIWKRLRSHFGRW